MPRCEPLIILIIASSTILTPIHYGTRLQAAGRQSANRGAESKTSKEATQKTERDARSEATADPDSKQRKPGTSEERVRQLLMLRKDDPNALAVVKRSLADGDWYVRGAAARALARLQERMAGDDLIQLLTDESWFVRQQGLEALGDSAGLKDPVKIMGQLASSDLYTRATLLRSLARVNDPAATNILLASLSDPEPLIRSASAFSLGEGRTRQAVDSLVGLLRDDDASVRQAAARSLGKIGDARALPSLADASKKDPDLDFAIAMYRLGDRAKVDLISEKVKSDYADEREDAVEALVESRNTSALPALLPLTKPLSGPSDAGAGQAALESRHFRLMLAGGLTGTVSEGLAGFKSDEAREALLGMIDDPDPQIRSAAIASLGRSVTKNGGGEFQGKAMRAVVAALKNDESPQVTASILDVLPSFDRAKITDVLLSARNEEGKLNPTVVRGLASVGVTTESQIAKLNDAEEASRLLSIERLGRLGDVAAVKPLIEALSRQKDLRTRAQAAKALGELRDRRSVEALMSAASDDAPDLRAASVEALGKIADPSCTDVLFAAAHDEDPRVRDAAVAALSGMGISAERVAADLSSSNWQTRSSALATLERLGDRKAVPLVLKALRDEDPRVRSEAARSLGGLGDASASASLISALSDPSIEVRLQAVTSLGRLKSSDAVAALSGLLNDRDPRLSLAAAESLARMRDPKASRVLINALKDQDGRVRTRAAHVLARVSADGPIDEAMGPLARALTDPDPVVRFYAAEALSGCGAKAVPYLIEVLKGARDADRERAGRVLRRIGEPAVDPLLGALQDRTASIDARASAAFALGVIGDRRAIVPLAALLREDHAALRQTAARALGLIGEPAVDQLLEMSRSNTPAVRESAVEALGSTSSSRAFDRLIEALRDSNASVRSAAIRALGETGNERAAAELIAILRDESNPSRAQAGASLGRLGTVAVGPLVQALADPKPSVRQLAAEALGNIGSPQAVKALIDLVGRDQSGARLEAIDALARIADPSAVDVLLMMARASSIAARKHAVAALTHFRDPRVVAALTSALSDQDEEVRLSAVNGLGEAGDQSVIPHLEKLVDKDTSSDVRAASSQAIERLRSQPASQRPQAQQKPLQE